MTEYLRPPVALITGAGGGIGAQLVDTFSEAGYDIAASDIKGLDDVGGGRASTRIVPISADLSDPDAPQNLVSQTLARFHHIDVLVNAAGWLRDARLHKLQLDEFDRIIDVNLVATAALTRAVLPAMRRQRFGRIVTLSSRAWLGNFGSLSYSTAKGGLVGATRQLALEVAADGITANCIAPGYIETEMSRSLPAHIRERILSSIPVGRPGQPIDVARTALFLCSPEAGYLTGQTIVICGGRSIGRPIIDASRATEVSAVVPPTARPA